MALLATFGITAGVGATKSIKKKSQQVQQTQAEIDLEKTKRELRIKETAIENDQTLKERKAEIDLEKIKANKEIELARLKARHELEIKKAEIQNKKEVEIAKVKAPVVQETKTAPTKLLTPEQYADLTEQQQDEFVNNGGIVTSRIRSKGEKTWSNSGGWFDSTLINDPDRGAVIRDSTQYLWFKVHDASNFSVLIREEETKKIVQLEQSQTGIARIEADQLPIGKYEYKISATGRGTSYSVGAEGKFQVIAD